MAETRPDIVAVIVTYNRLELLRRCVETVRAQVPRPGRIVVVDNASTDGTPEWLAAQRDLTIVRQSNCGSAGAYHSGFARALAFEPTWIWSMDDDGHPEPGCLGELLAQAERHGLDLLGPVVASTEDAEELAFPTRGWTRVARMEEAARDGVVHGTIALFNGTLLNRRVFETVGNIKREMFIWGDEWEYTLRVRRAGLKDGTAVNARLRHPRNRRPSQKVLGGLLGSVDICGDARQPFYFRNMGYIDATYFKATVIPKAVLKHTVHFLIQRDLGSLKRFYAGYFAGLADRYPEELRTLPTPLPLPRAGTARETVA